MANFTGANKLTKRLENHREQQWEDEDARDVPWRIRAPA